MRLNIQNLADAINQILWSSPFLVLFITTGIYFTFKLKFPQIKLILSLLKIKGKKNNEINLEKIKEKNNSNKKITPYKTLMTILAGTLGTGNITGVATSIIIGGIGSIFWLFVSGFIAIVISYCENYIVLKYRKHDKKRGYYGGTMYVLEEELGKKKLAVVFAIFTILSTIGMGAMIQSNSLVSTINLSFNVNKTVVASLVSIVSLYVVFGGKYRIAKLSSILVPICSITYVLLCFVIILNNIQNVPSGISSILRSAFGIKPIIGGITGISILKIISAGFSRGMFSNEAGMGSAPMFSSVVEDKDYKLQARIASTSVFIDTIILCTLTGITIVSANALHIEDVNELITATFSNVKYGEELLSICMMVFVVANIPCWEYYGQTAIYYLFKNNFFVKMFKLVYVLFIYIGAMSTPEIIWNVSSIFNLLMSLPNIYMLYKLEDKIKM